MGFKILKDNGDKFFSNVVNLALEVYEDAESGNIVVEVDEWEPSRIYLTEDEAISLSAHITSLVFDRKRKREEGQL